MTIREHEKRYWSSVDQVMQALNHKNLLERQHGARFTFMLPPFADSEDLPPELRVMCETRAKQLERLPPDVRAAVIRYQELGEDSMKIKRETVCAMLDKGYTTEQIAKRLASSVEGIKDLIDCGPF